MNAKIIPFPKPKKPAEKGGRGNVVAFPRHHALKTKIVSDDDYFEVRK